MFAFHAQASNGLPVPFATTTVLCLCTPCIEQAGWLRQPASPCMHISYEGCAMHLLMSANESTATTPYISCKIVDCMQPGSCE